MGNFICPEKQKARTTNKGVISGAYSAYDLTDFLLALEKNSPLQIYALSD